MAKSWKASELAIARLLGGERVPVNGRQRGSAPDVLHSWLAIEVKAWRDGGPSRIAAAMAQARASAEWSKRKEGKTKLPIAVIHHDHHDHHNDLVVLSLGDFLEWFGSSAPPQLSALSDITAQEQPNGSEEPAGLRGELGRRRVPVSS